MCVGRNLSLSGFAIVVALYHYLSESIIMIPLDSSKVLRRDRSPKLESFMAYSAEKHQFAQSREL